MGRPIWGESLCETKARLARAPGAAPFLHRAARLGVRAFVFFWLFVCFLSIFSCKIKNVKIIILRFLKCSEF
jgi:hypothetical protein